MNLTSSAYTYINKSMEAKTDQANKAPEHRSVQEALLAANQSMMMFLITGDKRFEDESEPPTDVMEMMMKMLRKHNKPLYEEILVCEALVAIINTLRALPIPSSEIMSILATGFLENKNTFAPKVPATNTPPI